MVASNRAHGHPAAALQSVILSAEWGPAARMKNDKLDAVIPTEGSLQFVILSEDFSPSRRTLQAKKSQSLIAVCNPHFSI